MEHNKIHLNALLDLIDHIGSTRENAWFLIELRKRLSSHFPETNVNLLTFAGRKFRAEGNEFYSYVGSDNKLRNELSEYYKRMRIAYALGNYVEYGLRLSLQLETMFTYLCYHLDAWSIVQKNKFIDNSLNTIIISQQNNYEDKIYLLNEFYIKDNQAPNSFPYKKKQLSSVSYKCKAAFCLDYFKVKEYERNWGNFSQLYKLRNFGSHTKVGDDNASPIKKIIEGFPAKTGFYEQTLREYSSCLKKYFQST